MTTENIVINRLANYIAQILIANSKQKLDIAKIVYGLEIFIINFSKFLIIYGVSLLFRQLIKTLIIHFAFILTKRYSFGIHAKSSTVCTLYCLTILVFIPYILIHYFINNYLTLLIFTIIISIHYKYAPADTVNNPIIGRENRIKLKVKSIVCVFSLALITLCITNSNIRNLLILGSVFQTISLLPITYKILKRRRNNYEIYE